MKNSIIENGVLTTLDKKDVHDGCVDISEEVEKIGSLAFFCRDDGVKKIHISKNLKEICATALSCCRELEEIEVDSENPNFFVQDGCLIFVDYLKRKILVKAFAFDKIPEDVVEIGTESFKEQNISELFIPKSVQYLDSNFARNCKKLTSVKFENDSSVRMISFGAFQDCKKLKEINLPNNIMGISEHAFEGCSSLEKIVIPENVTSINRNAFKGCSNLTEIVVPFGVKHIGKDAFEGCDKLEFVVEYARGKFQRVNKEWLYSQFLTNHSQDSDFDYESCVAMRKAIKDIVNKAEKNAIAPATVLSGEYVEKLNAKPHKKHKNEIEK